MKISCKIFLVIYTTGLKQFNPEDLFFNSLWQACKSKEITIFIRGHGGMYVK